MKKTGAHRILGTQSTLRELFGNIKAELLASSYDEPSYDITFEEIPRLEQLFPKLGNETEKDSFVAYPAAASYPSLDDLVIILHSSGSTGLPKPIPFTHLFLLKNWVQRREFRTLFPFCWHAILNYMVYSINIRVS